MSHAQHVRVKVRDLIIAFLRGHAAYNPKTRRVFCISVESLNAEFVRHRKELYEKHQAECEACANQDDCILDFALVELTPDPVTGVISAFHEYLLQNGNFEATNTMGEINITYFC